MIIKVCIVLMQLQLKTFLRVSLVGRFQLYGILGCGELLEQAKSDGVSPRVQ